MSDSALPDQSYFTSNKDIQPIASGVQHWGCDPINNPLDKDNLLNAYAALVQVPANAPDNAGHQVLYLASERGSNNGTSFAGFWLLKDKNVGCSGSNDFSGQHTDGDLLIISDYTNGGGTQDVSVYRWTGDDATGSPVLDTTFNGSICSGSLSNDNACAIANSATITTPWSPTSHDSNTFVETGIDLTALLGANGGCFTNFLAETRSSRPVDRHAEGLRQRQLQHLRNAAHRHYGHARRLVEPARCREPARRRDHLRGRRPPRPDRHDDLLPLQPVPGDSRRL